MIPSVTLVILALVIPDRRGASPGPALAAIRAPLAARHPAAPAGLAGTVGAQPPSAESAIPEGSSDYRWFRSPGPVAPGS